LIIGADRPFETLRCVYETQISYNVVLMVPILVSENKYLNLLRWLTRKVLHTAFYPVERFNFQCIVCTMESEESKA